MAVIEAMNGDQIKLGIVYDGPSKAILDFHFHYVNGTTRMWTFFNRAQVEKLILELQKQLAEMD